MWKIYCNLIRKGRKRFESIPVEMRLQVAKYLFDEGFYKKEDILNFYYEALISNQEYYDIVGEDETENTPEEETTTEEE